MIDLMLRFADEDEAAAVLAAYRADGQWLLASHEHALDVIGPVVSVDASDPRFHLNLRLLAGDAPAGLKAHIVNPAQPARVWA